MSLFFKQKLVVMMIDVSMACAVSKFSKVTWNFLSDGFTMLTLILLILLQIRVLSRVAGCFGMFLRF